MRSPHVMINKVDCTSKEGTKCRQFTSDIWKRAIVDDVVDIRRNSGQARHVKLGRSRKARRYNYESIPVIERNECSPSNNSTCRHTGWGIIAFVAGKATLVSDMPLVGHRKRIYLQLPQSALSDFIDLPQQALRTFRITCF